MRIVKRIVSKAKWITLGDQTFYARSKWEANYACYLEFLKKNNLILNWEHEPKTFWFEEIKRGVRSYLPDFRIDRKDGTHYWVEVKGFMDSKSATKIKRFNKYYKDEELVVISKDWFKQNSSKLMKYVQSWER